MGRSLETSKKASAGFTLTTEVIDLLKKKAAVEGLSLSHIAESIFRQFFELPEAIPHQKSYAIRIDELESQIKVFRGAIGDLAYRLKRLERLEGLE